MENQPDNTARPEPERITLDRDSTWDALRGFDSYEDFEALADALTFRPEVPPEVDGHFELVRDLVRFSFARYRLLDAAYERALLTLELALKRRHDELKGPIRGRKPTLHALIEWGVGEHLFEDGDRVVTALRHLRNKAAHPQGGMSFGYLSLQVIEQVARVVGELYEDPVLRRERLAEHERLQGAIHPLAEAGAIIDLADIWGKRLIIFRADALYVENRGRDEPAAFLAAWPIFDPGPDPTKLDLGNPILLIVDEWKTEGEGVRLRLGPEGGSTPRGVDRWFTIEPIRDEKNAETFAEWAARLGDGPFGLSGVHDSAGFHLRLVLRDLRAGRRPQVGRFQTEHLGSFPVEPGGSVTVAFSGAGAPSVTYDEPENTESGGA